MFSNWLEKWVAATRSVELTLGVFAITAYKLHCVGRQKGKRTPDSSRGMDCLNSRRARFTRFSGQTRLRRYYKWNFIDIDCRLTACVGCVIAAPGRPCEGYTTTSIFDKFFFKNSKASYKKQAKRIDTYIPVGIVHALLFFSPQSTPCQILSSNQRQKSTWCRWNRQRILPHPVDGWTHDTKGRIVRPSLDKKKKKKKNQEQLQNWSEEGTTGWVP